MVRPIAKRGAWGGCWLTGAPSDAQSPASCGLTRLAAVRCLSAAIVLDNGPEFVGRALDAWAYAHGVALRFIRRGKLTLM